MRRTNKDLRPKVKDLASLVVLVSLLLLPNVPAPRRTRAATNQARNLLVYDVRTFGAKGDGKTLDSTAINRAIDAAAAHGGGTVHFPAGNYLSVSIHLKSNIALYLDQGATIIAAETSKSIQYDAPEPNAWDKYQDFGHSHWHNS